MIFTIFIVLLILKLTGLIALSWGWLAFLFLLFVVWIIVGVCIALCK